MRVMHAWKRGTLLRDEEFHRMAAILSAMLETTSRRKSNLELVRDTMHEIQTKFFEKGK